MSFIAVNKVFVTSALICMMGVAGAVTVAPSPAYDLGTLNIVPVGKSNIQVSGSFNDYFKFVAGSLPSALGSMVGVDGSTSGDMMLSYRFGVGTTPTWGSFSPSATVPQNSETGVFALSTTFSGLQAGQTYWANLTGTASSASYSITLLPVPEPETYAMLLVGLGLMGAIARRRKNNDLGA